MEDMKKKPKLNAAATTSQPLLAKAKKTSIRTIAPMDSEDDSSDVESELGFESDAVEDTAEEEERDSSSAFEPEETDEDEDDDDDDESDR